MPTLIVNDVPQDLYDRLERMAAARKRSVEEAAVELLHEALPRAKSPAVRLPEFIEPQEIDPPFELQRPPSLGKVRFKTGAKRLPDPITEEDFIR
ncbi:MAG: FitA-like ribbon-helix-helix domain-containing protein [Gemmataceae bacterium]